MIAVLCFECENFEQDELDGEGLFWPPAGWEDVGPVDEAFAPGNYPDAWATHSGLCPYCVAAAREA